MGVSSLSRHLLYPILRWVEWGTPHSVSGETEAQGTGCSSLKVTADSHTIGSWDSNGDREEKAADSSNLRNHTAAPVGGPGPRLLVCKSEGSHA